jgi:hypothetical protein
MDKSKRIIYSEEFKIEAIKLVLGCGSNKAALWLNDLHFRLVSYFLKMKNITLPEALKPKFLTSKMAFVARKC